MESQPEPGRKATQAAEKRAEEAERQDAQEASEKQKAAEVERQAAQERLRAQVTEFIAKGEAYFKNHDYDRAIAACTDVISLDPQNARAYALRSWAHQLNKNQAKSLKDAQKAVALAPNFALGHAILAGAHAHTGEYDIAMRSKQGH